MCGGKYTGSFFLLFALWIGLGGGWFPGCQFFLEEKETVSLSLPPFPQSWMGRAFADEFEIAYTQEGREVRYAVPRGSGKVELSLSLGKRTPVVLYPIVTGEFGKASLYPAGGLYPDFFRSGELVIQWDDGFAAETLLLASRGGFPLDVFNCARFFVEARKRGGSNPWELNRGKVLESLASGTFRADRLALKKKFSIPLPLSGGEWYSVNLLEPPMPGGGEGTVLLKELPWGVHHYWSMDRFLTIHLSETGKVEFAEYGVH